MALSNRVLVLALPPTALLLMACGARPEPIQRQSPLVAVTQESAPATPSAELAEAPPLDSAPPQAPTQAAPQPPPEPPSLFVDRTRAPASTACRAVAHIGDSTSTGMMSDYHIPDPTLRIDAQYGRIGVEQTHLELLGGRSMVEHRAKNENGVMVAQRLRDAGFSGCWVIGLGTCDAANVAKDATVDRVTRIERMMAIIGDEPVMWIDTITRVEDGYWSAANMEVWNDELATTLSRYPNARIYRWSEDMRDDWFVKDGIHYNPKGYSARARMVAEALAAAFPGDK